MNLRNKFCVSKSRSICTNTNTHVELVSHEVSLWHEDEDVMKRKLCEEEIRRDRQTEQEWEQLCQRLKSSSLSTLSYKEEKEGLNWRSMCASLQGNTGSTVQWDTFTSIKTVSLKCRWCRERGGGSREKGLLDSRSQSQSLIVVLIQDSRLKDNWRTQGRGCFKRDDTNSNPYKICTNAETNMIVKKRTVVPERESETETSCLSQDLSWTSHPIFSLHPYSLFNDTDVLEVAKVGQSYERHSRQNRKKWRIRDRVFGGRNKYKHEEWESFESNRKTRGMFM